jgi:aminoglycoside phosphotransferase (APT) family kinase protein
VIPPLEELARERVAAVLGARSRVDRVTALRSGHDGAVVLVTLAGPPRRLVLKVAAARAAPAVDLERTAATSALARAAGAPVAAVLAEGAVPGSSGWSYLLQEHVEGVDWRGVRPQLDPRQLVAAHRQIATAVLAVQSVRFAGFGELDPGGEPVGADLGQALRRRAEQRIADPRRRAVFCELLEREADLLAGDRGTPTLCHDDLHHANVVFRAERGTWRLAGLLDWDKAWAGPAESDIARMAFWDDMTGPGFWEAYRAAVPSAEGEPERALVHQLLWCLEYPADTPRHRADTAALCRRLGLRHPE